MLSFNHLALSDWHVILLCPGWPQILHRCCFLLLPCLAYMINTKLKFSHNIDASTKIDFNICIDKKVLVYTYILLQIFCNILGNNISMIHILLHIYCNILGNKLMSCGIILDIFNLPKMIIKSGNNKIYNIIYMINRA